MNVAGASSLIATVISALTLLAIAFLVTRPAAKAQVQQGLAQEWASLLAAKADELTSIRAHVTELENEIGRLRARVRELEDIILSLNRTLLRREPHGKGLDDA